jgi:hypothetical protein
MTGEVIIELPGYCLYCHMTGEVIQLPGYCLYCHMTGEVIIPATRILSLYCHMTGKVIIQLPG